MFRVKIENYGRIKSTWARSAKHCMNCPKENILLVLLPTPHTTHMWRIYLTLLCGRDSVCSVLVIGITFLNIGITFFNIGGVSCHLILRDITYIALYCVAYVWRMWNMWYTLLHLHQNKTKNSTIQGTEKKEEKKEITIRTYA